MAKKYYAVRSGREGPQVYESWDECKRQVHGVAGAVYKSFPTRQEADVRQQEREAAQAGLININTADAAALCTLPGIGEARARDIISCRESEGPFESCEDIMKVPGIKDSVYEKIKDKITVH